MGRIDFNEDRLPSDVATFADEDFYGLIQAILGNTVSDLLRFQHINSVSNFLLEEDIFDVFLLTWMIQILMKLGKSYVIQQRMVQ